MGLEFTFRAVAVAAALSAPAATAEPTAPEVVSAVQKLTIVDTRTGASQQKVCCLSGADMAEGGGLIIVSDRGTLYGAALDLAASTLTLTTSAALTLSDGTPLPEWRADAEGVAIGPDGALHIAFEGDHRIAQYDGARGISSTAAPQSNNFAKNGGLEAVAVDASGALWSVPETAAADGFPLLNLNKGQWEAVGTLPASDGYMPVGADFDAAGELYVLERRLSFFQFMSRVRRLTFGASGIAAIDTIWQSEAGAFDNLEAIVVVEGDSQPTALLLISDDNAMPFQVTEAILVKLD